MQPFIIPYSAQRTEDLHLLTLTVFSLLYITTHINHQIVHYSEICKQKDQNSMNNINTVYIMIKFAYVTWQYINYNEVVLPLNCQDDKIFYGESLSYTV